MAIGTATAAWLFSSTALKSISNQSSNRGGKPTQKVESTIDTILGQSRLVVRVGKDLIGLIAGERSGLPAAVEGVRKRIAEGSWSHCSGGTFSGRHNACQRGNGSWSWTVIQLTIQSCQAGQWLLVPSAGDDVTRRRWREKRAATDEVLPTQCVRWGSPAEAEEVTSRGGLAFIGADAIAYVFEENLRRCVDRLLSRDQMARMLESLRSSEPATVEQTVPDVVSVATVQRTLQCLLREGLPIKPLAVLLEAIADHASEGCSPEQLAERLRSHIDRTIVRRLRDQEGHLTVIEVTPRAVESLIASESEVALRLEQKRLLAELQRALRPLQERGRRCAISVAPKNRGAFAEHMRAAGVLIAVVADTELQGQPGLEIFATIGTPGSSVRGGGRAA
jgi:flagellar biosynthesis component FlhA